MKHDEFQVERHRFGNEARALLRVDLRGAFFRLKENVFRQSTSVNSESNFGGKHYE